MSDSMLVGILVALAIAFLLLAYFRLPSFSFRSGASRSSKTGEANNPGTIPKASSKISSPAHPEAMSLDDEYRFNFRSARWGMPREQVKRSDDFTQPAFEDATQIVYKSRLGHMDCTVTFMMNPTTDELKGGRYDFTTAYEDGARYLSDFETLLDLYKERFGEPVEAETLWENKTFEKKKEFHGLAFMEGHFSRVVRWQTPRTGVVLSLGKQQGAIAFFIEYTWLEPEEPGLAETEPAAAEQTPSETEPAIED